MNICGIDLSTRALDLVCLHMDDDQAEWWHVDLEGNDVIERVRDVRHQLKPAAITWDDVLAVGIERPAGRYAVAQLSMVFGAVLACLPRDLMVKPWVPAEWRRAIGLRGNASKKEIATWLTWETGLASRSVFWSQDACDAYAIAYATRSAIHIEEAA